MNSPLRTIEESEVEASRKKFEYWFSESGAWPKAVERERDGSYRLSVAASAWKAWEASRISLNPKDHP
jgi:hypothetical protein